MIARLQQLSTLSIIASSLIFLSLLFRQGSYLLGVLTALGISFGYTIFIAAELVMLAVVTRPLARPPLSTLLRAWLKEIAIAPRVFYWRQPFRSMAFSDYLPDRPQGRTGILLVHGFLCNRGFWNPWMERLRRENIPFFAVNLEPPFGSIGGFSQQIESAVAQLHAKTGAPPCIVAHSMGGLAVRFWLQEHSADCRVDRIFTIGTPHLGTRLARYGRSENVRQMNVGSAWIHDLTTSSPAAGNALFTCFYSDCDNAIIPTDNATLEGAANRLIRGAGHVDLAFQPPVIEEVIEHTRLSGPVVTYQTM